MKKEEKHGNSSTQASPVALNEGKENGLTKTKGTAHFENLFPVVKANSANLIANLLKIQYSSKSFSFGVE